MRWVRWATTVGPLAAPWAAFARKAARIARGAVHIIALGIVLDAAVRLVVGRRDLVGASVLLVFICSAAAVGLVLLRREPRLGLRAHVDEVALGLAALILEYFLLALGAERL